MQHRLHPQEEAHLLAAARALVNACFPSRWCLVGSIRYNTTTHIRLGRHQRREHRLLRKYGEERKDTRSRHSIGSVVNDHRDTLRNAHRAIRARCIAKCSRMRGFNSRVSAAIALCGLFLSFCRRSRRSSRYSHYSFSMRAATDRSSACNLPIFSGIPWKS